MSAKVGAGREAMTNPLTGAHRAALPSNPESEGAAWSRVDDGTTGRNPTSPTPREKKEAMSSTEVKVGGLTVRRIDADRRPYPFEVVVSSGPAKGQRLDVFRRKCDAVAAAERWAELPWPHLLGSVDDAHRCDAPIVTVSTFELRLRLRQLAAVERELATAREALVMFDGSAMVVARLRARHVAAEAGR